ncbi:MAG: hypothetical protein KBG28_00590 [Kofleriaceae bacterium]|nr:hypothetical protein [Kofleriaceae bacterium]MBP6842040.1 hypothetical protein [Kofleriaceae bacterium]MBP9202446.1 hypothetical protein [Kofleriaceae bacterium]
MHHPIKSSLTSRLARSFVAALLLAPAVACVDASPDADDELWSDDGKADSAVFAAETAKLADLMKNNTQAVFHTYGDLGTVVSDRFRRVSLVKDAQGQLLAIVVFHVRRGTASGWETKSFTEYHVFDNAIATAGARAGTVSTAFTTYFDLKNNGAVEVAGLRHNTSEVELDLAADGAVTSINFPQTRVPMTGPRSADTVRSALTLDSEGYAFRVNGRNRVEAIWAADPSLAVESVPANIPAPPTQVPPPGEGMAVAEAAPWARAILAESSIRHFATYGVPGANKEASTYRSISLIVADDGSVRGYMDHFGRAGAADTASSTGIILLRDGETADGGVAEFLADLNNDGKLEVNGGAAQVRLWIDDAGVRVEGATMNKLGTNPPEAIRVDISATGERYLLDGISGLKQPDGTVVVPAGAPNGGRFYQTSVRIR